MGQVALGLRSLVIKSGIFFVMAALLAWALGGTLWPRDASVEYDGVTYEGRQWYWRLVVGGRRHREATWQLMTRVDDKEAAAVNEDRWEQPAGPLVVGDGLYYGGRRRSEGPGPDWRIVAHHGDATPRVHVMPDRLAVEQQLARLAAGLPIQDEVTIRRERAAVLEPADGTSGEPGGL